MFGNHRCSDCGREMGCVAGLCDDCYKKSELRDAVLDYQLGRRKKPRVRMVWNVRTLFHNLIYTDAGYCRDEQPEFELILEENEE